MERLDKMRCEACRVGAPLLTEPELKTLHRQLPQWTIVDSDGIRKLQRSFEFDDFAQSLAFADEVGAMAEAEGHHPTLLVEWGQTTVTWWSMKIKGLHRNDFIAAAKTDRLYRKFRNVD